MTKLLLVLGLGLLSIGCTSDAEAICDKLDECNSLTGTSVDECTEEIEDEVSEGAISDCSDCVDDESCSDLTNTDACDSECASLLAQLID